MIDIEKLDSLLRDLFAEGYDSGHEDGVNGTRPTKRAKSTHGDILRMAEESNAEQVKEGRRNAKI